MYSINFVFKQKSISVYLINSLCLSKKSETGCPRVNDGKSSSSKINRNQFLKRNSELIPITKKYTIVLIQYLLMRFSFLKRYYWFRFLRKKQWTQTRKLIEYIRTCICFFLKRNSDWFRFLRKAQWINWIYFYPFLLQRNSDCHVLEGDLPSFTCGRPVCIHLRVALQLLLESDLSHSLEGNLLLIS